MYFFLDATKRGFFTANVANVIADYRNRQLVFFYAELAAPPLLLIFDNTVISIGKSYRSQAKTKSNDYLRV